MVIPGFPDGDSFLLMDSSLVLSPFYPLDLTLGSLLLSRNVG